MNAQTRLYSQDYRPIRKEVPSKNTWERVNRPATCKASSTPGMFILNFSHVFETTGDAVYFAFCYPFSYDDMQNKLDAIEKQMNLPKYNSILFSRELITTSLNARRMELLTISSYEEYTDDLETVPDTHIFPEGRKVCRFQPKGNKKAYFVSARVHPGETPGQHIFNGFLDFILSLDDPRAIKLRSMFVFYMVPMLNPDGVAEGHYRADTLGQNLNRFYQEPSWEKHPTIAAVKCVVTDLWDRGNLLYYVDLHAHASKRGAFIYGNNINDIDKQVDNVLFAKVLALNTPYFDFSACNFTEKNMKARDKRDGLSKEGSGRVGIFTATGMTHSYTLEANFNMIRFTNITAECANDPSVHSPRHTQSMALKYRPEHWAHIGKALAITALDMHDKNPWSRLTNTSYGTLQGVKNAVLTQLKSQPNYRVMAKKSLQQRLASVDSSNSTSNTGSSSLSEKSIAGHDNGGLGKKRNTSQSSSLSSLSQSSTSAGGSGTIHAAAGSGKGSIGMRGSVKDKPSAWSAKVSRVEEMRKAEQAKREEELQRVEAKRAAQVAQMKDAAKMEQAQRRAKVEVRHQAARSIKQTGNSSSIKPVKTQTVVAPVTAAGATGAKNTIKPTFPIKRAPSPPIQQSGGVTLQLSVG